MVDSTKVWWIVQKNKKFSAYFELLPVWFLEETQGNLNWTVSSKYIYELSVVY